MIKTNGVGGSNTRAKKYRTYTKVAQSESPIFAEKYPVIGLGDTSTE